MDWDLLDLTGPVSTFDIHWASEALIYAAGTVVVIWDVHTDQRVNLRCHEATVTRLFLTPD
jgi:hypothetical protein